MKIVFGTKAVNPPATGVLRHEADGFTTASCRAKKPNAEFFKAADEILASGLVQNEAGIRADEREKCANIAENFDHADTWPGCDRDHELSNVTHVIGGETCDAIADAIRSARDGGE